MLQVSRGLQTFCGFPKQELCSFWQKSQQWIFRGAGRFGFQMGLKFCRWLWELLMLLTSFWPVLISTAVRNFRKTGEFHIASFAELRFASVLDLHKQLLCYSLLRTFFLFRWQPINFPRFWQKTATCLMLKLGILIYPYLKDGHDVCKKNKVKEVMNEHQRVVIASGTQT